MNVVLLFIEISKDISLLVDKSKNLLFGFKTDVFKLDINFSSKSNNNKIFLFSLVSNNLQFSIVDKNSSLNLHIVVFHTSLHTSFSEELFEFHLHK